MTRTHRFRVIKASWGVAVDLTAHLEGDSASGTTTPKVRFSNESLAEMHRRHAELGVTAVVKGCPDRATSLLGKTLVIDDINYNPTDFQDEGIACAVAGWLCEELSMQANPLSLEFDLSRNRYMLKEAI